MRVPTEHTLEYVMRLRQLAEPSSKFSSSLFFQCVFIKGPFFFLLTAHAATIIISSSHLLCVYSFFHPSLCFIKLEESSLLKNIIIVYQLYNKRFLKMKKRVERKINYKDLMASIMESEPKTISHRYRMMLLDIVTAGSVASDHLYTLRIDRFP